MRFLAADKLFLGKGEALNNKALAINNDNSIFDIVDLSDPILKDAEIQSFSGILSPGFVNTHCHLELSWAKSLIQEGKGLDEFIQNLQELKKQIPIETCFKSIESGLLEMQNSGTVAVADICNTAETIKSKTSSPIYFHNFLEVFGSNPKNANEIIETAQKLKKSFFALQPFPVSITPHATYSVSNELHALIGEESQQILSIHHQENDDENVLFKTGTGPIAERRKRFNPNLENFIPTGKRPMQSIAHHFNIEAAILLVHNTVSTSEDVAFIGNYFANAYWCLCPNANLYIEHRLPEVAMLRKQKAKITLGTDSLASNNQLSILHEMITIQTHYPEIPLLEILEWATRNGANFLGIAREAGTFEKGKSPGVVLIENIDIERMKLKNDSTSRILIPAKI